MYIETKAQTCINTKQKHMYTETYTLTRTHSPTYPVDTGMHTHEYRYSQTDTQTTAMNKFGFLHYNGSPRNNL